MRRPTYDFAAARRARSLASHFTRLARHPVYADPRSANAYHRAAERAYDLYESLLTAAARLP